MGNFVKVELKPLHSPTMRKVWNGEWGGRIGALQKSKYIILIPATKWRRGGSTVGLLLSRNCGDLFPPFFSPRAFDSL